MMTIAISLAFSVHLHPANNPDLTVAASPAITGPSVIGNNNTASFIATLHWPDGVSNPGGQCTWSYETINGGAIRIDTSPNPEPTSTRNTFTVTVTGTAIGKLKLKASWTTSVSGYTSPADDTIDITVIELQSIDGYIYGESGRKIEHMENLTTPANVVASGYVKFVATINPSEVSDDLYYKWAVTNGTLTNAEGAGDDYLEVKWDAPDGHEQNITLTLEVKIGESIVCTDTVELKTIRPYVVRVKFVDDFWNEEQQISDGGDPEFDAISGKNFPVCYVMHRGMQVQVDLAGSKTDESVNNLTRQTKIRIRAKAKYGGIENQFDDDSADENTENWSTSDFNTVEIESDDNVPNMVREYEDFEMQWTFEVKNSSSEWISSYQEETNYSQKTIHKESAGGKTYGLYLIYDVHKFSDDSYFKKLTLDYACHWADGKSLTKNILQAELDGFNTDYQYVAGGNCYYLSKDFCNVSKCLGIDATMHRWNAVNDGRVGYMKVMYPNQFDPCGATSWTDFKNWFGDGSNSSFHGWSFHAFTEADGAIYDPSAHTKQTGTWRKYEDICFDKYSRCEKLLPLSSYIWDKNKPGQSKGCEARATHTTPVPGAFSGPPTGGF